MKHSLSDWTSALIYIVVDIVLVKTNLSFIKYFIA